MALDPAALGLGFKLVTGLFGGKSRQREAERQNQLEMEKFVRLRKAAEAGGFHPLEALRSGQTVDARARPSIMSSLAASGAFDAFEDVITGEAARKQKREAVEDEIRERELDKLRYEVAQQQVPESSIPRGRPPRIPSGDVDINDNDNYDRKMENPDGLAKTEHGLPVPVYEGPDPFEVAMGWVNAKRSDARADTNWRAMNSTPPMRPIAIPAPIAQQMAAGRKRPGDEIRYKGKTWILNDDGTMTDKAHESRPKGGAFSG